jgi:hypothetical protein
LVLGEVVDILDLLDKLEILVDFKEHHPHIIQQVLLQMVVDLVDQHLDHQQRLVLAEQVDLVEVELLMVLQQVEQELLPQLPLQLQQQLILLEKVFKIMVEQELLPQVIHTLLVAVVVLVVPELLDHFLVDHHIQEFLVVLENNFQQLSKIQNLVLDILDPIARDSGLQAEADPVPPIMALVDLVVDIQPQQVLMLVVVLEVFHQSLLVDNHLEMVAQTVVVVLAVAETIQMAVLMPEDIMAVPVSSSSLILHK